MNSLEALSVRRGRLLERAQHEREKIARDLAPFAGALRIVDRCRAGANWLQMKLREQPLLVGAALGIALLARPRRALRWLRLAVGAWQTWKWLGGAVRAASKQE